MDRLSEDVTNCVRIGLRHARQLVSVLPINKQDGTKRTVEEFRDLVIHGITQLEKEDLIT
jgi:hypothetical protein